MQRNSPVFPPQVVWGQWICILHYSDLHILDVWEHAVSRLLRECIMKIELQNAKFKNHSRWALILDFIEHYFIRNRSILYTLSPHFYLFWLWFEKTNLVDDLLKDDKSSIDRFYPEKFWDGLPNHSRWAFWILSNIILYEIYFAYIIPTLLLILIIMKREILLMIY